MVGLMFALYKKDYIAINGFDDNYKGGERRMMTFLIDFINMEEKCIH